MPAELCGLTASLDVTFDADSRVKALQSTPGMELRGPFHEAGSPPTYFLRNVTAGVFADDCYRTAVCIESGAQVSLSGASATKVYEMAHGRAEAHASIEVRARGSLVYTPPPLILQRGSDFLQSTTISVGEGSSLFLAEVLILGRLARGEQCEFTRFRNSLVIKDAQSSSILTERFTLRGEDASMRATVGSFGVLASIVSLGGRPEVSLIRNELNALAGTWAGVTTLRHGGLFVKLAAESTEGTLSAIASLQQVMRAIRPGSRD